MNQPDTPPSELSRVMQDIATTATPDRLAKMRDQCSNLTHAAPTAQPTKRATVTEGNKELAQTIFMRIYAVEAEIDTARDQEGYAPIEVFRKRPTVKEEVAQLLADSEAETVEQATYHIREVMRGANTNNEFLRTKLAAETARAFEAEKEARSFASKLICCENDLKVAERNLHLIADYVEPHWRGVCVKLDASWILHELMERARKYEDAVEKGDTAEAEIAELRKDISQFREWLATCYAGTSLYHDDGELQDSRQFPWIDFRRDSVESLRMKFLQRTNAANARKTPAFQSENAGIEASMARKTGGGT